MDRVARAQPVRRGEGGNTIKRVADLLIIGSLWNDNVTQSKVPAGLMRVVTLSIFYIDR